MRWFATTRWCWEDISSINESWTKKQCEDFLEKHEEGIKEGCISTGWDVINTLLELDEKEAKSDDKKENGQDEDD